MALVSSWRNTVFSPVKCFVSLGKKKEGKAAKYITRTKAVRYLRVSLSTFRKLCMLKGISPRKPKKVEGNHKIYYYRKDIKILLHDPLVEKFRDRAYKKKLKKALANEANEAAEKKQEYHEKPSMEPQGTTYASTLLKKNIQNLSEEIKNYKFKVLEKKRDAEILSRILMPRKKQKLYNEMQMGIKRKEQINLERRLKAYAKENEAKEKAVAEAREKEAKFKELLLNLRPTFCCCCT